MASWLHGFTARPRHIGLMGALLPFIRSSSCRQEAWSPPPRPTPRARVVCPASSGLWGLESSPWAGSGA